MIKQISLMASSAVSGASMYQGIIDRSFLEYAIGSIILSLCIGFASKEVTR